MKQQCPHCGAQVRLEPRHGLSGGLCPACHQVVAAEDAAPNRPARPRILNRPQGTPVCAGCGGVRNRDGLRCPECATSWLFRTLALDFDDDLARERLVEFILRRESRAMSRRKLEAATRRPPMTVLEQLSETQARRARQEIEAFGVRGAVEPDDTPPPKRPADPTRQLQVLAVLAIILLAVGIYRVVEFSRPAEVAERPARPAAAAPPAAPADTLDAVVQVEAPGAATGFYVDPAGWLIAPDQGERITLAGDDALAARRQGADHGFGLYRVEPRAPFALSAGERDSLEPGVAVFVAEPGAALRDDAVEAVDVRLGRRLFLRLKTLRGARFHGAPVLNTNGLVVGVYDHHASERAAAPLALPIDLLARGDAPLLAPVRRSQPLDPAFADALGAAAAADRAERPELYRVVEDRLLHTLRCEARVCSGRVGLFTLGVAPPDVPVAAAFYRVDQDPDTGAAPGWGMAVPALEGRWAQAPMDDSKLVDAIPRALRERLLEGAFHDLRLYERALALDRPPGARGDAFRVQLRAGPRRSAVDLVGAASP